MKQLRPSCPGSGQAPRRMVDQYGQGLCWYCGRELSVSYRGLVHIHLEPREETRSSFAPPPDWDGWPRVPGYCTRCSIRLEPGAPSVARCSWCRREIATGGALHLPAPIPIRLVATVDPLEAAPVWLSTEVRSRLRPRRRGVTEVRYASPSLTNPPWFSNTRRSWEGSLVAS